MSDTISLKKGEKKRPLGVARTKKVNSSKETRRSWYHAIDTMYVHIRVKFERSLSISLGEKKEAKLFPKERLNSFFC
jgi:hypothetical protein